MFAEESRISEVPVYVNNYHTDHRATPQVSTRIESLLLSLANEQFIFTAFYKKNLILFVFEDKSLSINEIQQNNIITIWTGGVVFMR